MAFLRDGSALGLDSVCRRGVVRPGEIVVGWGCEIYNGSVAVVGADHGCA
jgi:hypothetical protein